MSNLKRFLALTMAMLMVVGVMATASAKTFADVADDAAYTLAVDVLSDLDVIKGTGDDEFSPDALVTREQMALFICRLITAKPGFFAVSAPAVFADQTDATYNAAIKYASEQKIIVGTSATEFSGGATVTLEQAVTMLSRALGYYSNSMNASYPISYLLQADQLGLLADLDDVAPTAELTRGEVALLLYNTFNAKVAKVTAVVPNGSPDRVFEEGTDSLAVATWKVSENVEQVAATSKLAIVSNSVLSPSKGVADPIKLGGKTVSFSAISKFFAEGTTAEDLLGVNLNVFRKGDTILKVELLGDNAYITSGASVKDGVVTVAGVKYDLFNYPNTDLDLGDNCFYVYQNNVLTNYNTTKVVTVDGVDSTVNKTKADIDSDFAAMTNGLYVIEMINEGAANQMIVYKPISVAVVTVDADKNLEINGADITNNIAGAVKDDFVAYYNGGSNLVEVFEVAVKAENDKVVKINSNGTATLASGAVVPAATSGVSGSVIRALATANLGEAINVYKISGVVVKTELFSAAAPYAPKNYYKVLAVADRIADSDGFASTYTYKIQVVDVNGAVSVLTLTHINDAELAKVEKVSVVAADDVTLAGWNTQKSVLVGKYITVEGNKIYTVLTTDKFFGDKTNETVVTTPVKLEKVNTNVYKISATQNVILTDNTKIVILGNDNKYATFNGKSLTEFGTATFTNISAVVRNNGGLLELVHYYATADVASTALLKTTEATERPAIYLFDGHDSTTATSITYVALNLKTGAQETLTFNNAEGNTTVPTTLEAIGATSEIYTVGANAPAVYTAVDKKASAVTTLHASGYLVADSVLYTTVGTKYYKWDAEAKKYVTATVTSDTAAFAATLVVTAEGNVDYVIVR